MYTSNDIKSYEDRKIAVIGDISDSPPTTAGKLTCYNTEFENFSNFLFNGVGFRSV